MPINLSALTKAYSALVNAVERTENSPPDDMLRDACIQRFEYTFELCIKLLKRQLAKIEMPSQIDLMSYKDLIRSGAQHGLIDDPLAWFDFREKRNITSHTYDEKKAEDIYKILTAFIEKSGLLLQQLRFRNA